MDDVRAVEQVLLDYFDGVDRRDPEAAVSVFAPDARAEIMTGKVLEGRDRIGRALGRVLVRYARTSHHPTNARVEIDGDRAVLRTYVYAYHRMTTGDVWHLWARLYDGMERRDGRWLIVDHRLTGVDSEPHRPDIGNEWYGGHPGHLAPGADPGCRRRRPPGARGRGPGRRSRPRAHPRRGGDRRRAERRRRRRSSWRPPPRPAATRHSCATPSPACGRSRFPPSRPGRPPPRSGSPAGRRSPAASSRRSSPTTARPRQGEPHAEPFDSRRRAPYFRSHFGGEVPERVALLADRSPSAFAGYALLHRGVLREGALEPKLAELLLCAVNAAEYQSAFVEIHAQSARAAGASEAELVDAIVAVIPVAGVAAWAAAAGAVSGA